MDRFNDSFHGIKELLGTPLCLGLTPNGMGFPDHESKAYGAVPRERFSGARLCDIHLRHAGGGGTCNIAGPLARVAAAEASGSRA